MALGAEAQAVIQLLLVQRQSYADIAGLLGVSETEVRTRARAALTELGDADPDREAALTDYLLGQGDAIDRADAIRHLRSSPADREMAARMIAELRAIAPDADLPRLPGEPRGGGPGRLAGLRERLPSLPARRPGGQPATVQPGAPEATERDPKRTRIFAAIAAGVIVLLVVVLAVTGVFGGSDEGSGSATASSESTSTADGSDPTSATDLGEGQDVQAVPLRAEGGGDASGVATVGITTDSQVPYLDVEIQDLQAPNPDQVYFIWFVQEDGQGYPFVPLEINADNAKSFSDRFEIPTEYIPVLESASRSPEGAIEVWLSPSRELGKNIQSAVREEGFVEIPGEKVLSGSLAPPEGQGGGAGAGGQR
ncbi:hypothetical protein HJD18_08050 [Thermoleophilia bacterium SCSIO 60948]|nr:hypothetical protein HJD18_08050 [Thermoleophilia bacterium SCSIO 60948]